MLPGEQKGAGGYVLFWHKTNMLIALTNVRSVENSGQGAWFFMRAHSTPPESAHGRNTSGRRSSPAIPRYGGYVE